MNKLSYSEKWSTREDIFEFMKTLEHLFLGVNYDTFW